MNNKIKMHTFPKSLILRSVDNYLFVDPNKSFTLVKINLRNIKIEKTYTINDLKDFKKFIQTDSNFYFELANDSNKTEIEKSWSKIESNFCNFISKCKNKIDDLEINSSFQSKSINSLDKFFEQHEKTINDFIKLTLFRDTNFYNKVLHAVDLTNNKVDLLNLNQLINEQKFTSFKDVENSYNNFEFNQDEYEFRIIPFFDNFLTTPIIRNLNNKGFLIPFCDFFAILYVKKNYVFCINNQGLISLEEKEKNYKIFSRIPPFLSIYIDEKFDFEKNLSVEMIITKLANYSFDCWLKSNYTNHQNLYIIDQSDKFDENFKMNFNKLEMILKEINEYLLKDKTIQKAFVFKIKS
ncbi:hypothetical protein MENTO_v1c04390 [Mesoplasma entomophilum]|uniref:Uncharacterized protein n=1 Tax=Mesoplasma entomophilum TaxID=2149 RepID=A0A3S5XZ84_9MOLU|nr:hypothetical protein [Mesoplasma entomophilum]ATQ35578.1 hypothetical protein CS528_02280 [Mesoplasma entomophilum]ATZ19544.1 hypothetical protein MENTO_v1c04390 [Mesoplasma entomophilum]